MGKGQGGSRAYEGKSRAYVRRGQGQMRASQGQMQDGGEGRGEKDKLGRPGGGGGGRGEGGLQLEALRLAWPGLVSATQCQNA